MGLYDDKALIETAISTNGEWSKAYYIGYSQGTIQMHYSLAHIEESFHASNTYKVLSMAPCFYLADYMSIDEYFATIDQFDEYGMYAFNGPNWDTDYDTVVDNIPIA